ncbi:universal stress protein [Ilumatobacter sp.]|uniref:universal stress protein n=1 Tax=Ilumatobacter sp. TaxID=1967498 RepID=UPI003B517BC7
MGGIVVGVDESATARRAAVRAVEIARALDEPLHLVMSVKDSSSQVVRRGGDEFVIDRTEQAERTIDSIKSDIGAPDARSTVGGTDPADSLCEEAERVGASMIVVGNRRVQGVSRVLGAIASDVLRQAPCDVLVAHTVDDD